jgi:hypothetical protein
MSNDQSSAGAIKNLHGVEYYPTRRDTMQKGFQQIGHFTIIATVLAGLAVASFCLGSCSRGGYSGKMESIAIWNGA